MSMDELNRYQKSLIDALEAENEKYQTVDKDLDMDQLLAKANYYCNKLRAIKKEMAGLRHQSDQLRRRALRLQSNTSRHIEVAATEKYNQTERERRLQPVLPAHQTSHPPPHSPHK